MKSPIQLTEDNGQGELDLLGIAATLWVGKWWIALTAALGLSLAATWLALTPPTYQANALIQIENKAPKLALSGVLSDLVGSGSEGSASELILLHSRLTLGTAVARAHLDWVAVPVQPALIGHAVATGKLYLPEIAPFASYERPNEGITLGYLKVPPAWVNLAMTLTYQGGGNYQIELPDGAVILGKIGETAVNEDQDFAINVASIRGVAGRKYSVRQVSELAAIASLDGALGQSELGGKTGVVNVTFTATNPEFARQTLNAIVNAFYEQNLARSSAEAQKSLEFVQSQIPKANANVARAEKAFNDYVAVHKSVDLSFETQSLLTETQTTEAKLREMAQAEQELKQKYTPDHPLYKQLLDTRAALQGRQGQLSEQISDLPTTQKEILNLTRDLANAQAGAEALAQRAQELGVLTASTIGNVRIVDNAATPPAPIAPNKTKLKLLGLVLGAVVGAAAVVLRDLLRGGIENVEQIEALGIPVFATISLFMDQGQSRADVSPSVLIARDRAGSVLEEEFKSLRTSMHFGMVDAKNRTIAFTSGAPEVGKSFVAANLAAVMAASGTSVCLIDADMRRGKQRLRFGVGRSTVGLSDYLSQDIALGDVLIASGIDGLAFINTGEFPPNPSELLGTDKFKGMLAALSQQFDLIIVDCPPVLAVTDASVVGRLVGATFIVVRHQKTELSEIVATKRTLEAAGVTITGAVMNAYDRRNLRGYARYQSQYGYHYSYAYQTGDDDR